MHKVYNPSDRKGKRIQCIECCRIANKKRSSKHKLQGIAYKGGKCVVCGFDDVTRPEVFDFHHVDPREKEYTLGKMKSFSWEHIKEELDKCILLCGNCHRTMHSKQE